MEMQPTLPLIPVVVQNLHFKGFGSLGHFVANSSHPHDPQGCPRNLSAQPVCREILCVGGDCHLIALEEGKDENMSCKGCPGIRLLVWGWRAFLTFYHKTGQKHRNGNNRTIIE